MTRDVATHDVERVSAGLSVVMPALVAGIHVFLERHQQDVDGRTIAVRRTASLRSPMPGHDVERVSAGLSVVMPGFMPGIHVFLCHTQDVDGRTIAVRRTASFRSPKSGHDLERLNVNR